jgi:hypothetical protein
MASHQAFPSALNIFSLDDLTASVVNLGGGGRCGVARGTVAVVLRALGFQDGLIKGTWKALWALPYQPLAAGVLQLP